MSPLNQGVCLCRNVQKPAEPLYFEKRKVLYFWWLVKNTNAV